MKTIRRSFVALGLVAWCLLSLGCSKEKATALKGAAEQARSYAVSALGSTRDLIRQTVAMPSISRDQQVSELAGALAQLPAADLTPEVLRNAMTEGEIGAGANSAIDKEFAELQSKYLLFASMFRSLPQGNYLAGDAVSRAEAHAIRLSTEFMNFAQTVGRNPVIFTGRQTLLLEQISRAKSLKDQAARDELLQRCARDAFQLRADELKARETAVTQCLQAAEAFKTCAELIRNYEKTSLSDILTITKDLLSTANDISGQNPDLTKLLDHYQQTEQSIRSDPYWQSVLSRPLNP